MILKNFRFPKNIDNINPKTIKTFKSFDKTSFNKSNFLKFRDFKKPKVKRITGEDNPKILKKYILDTFDPSTAIVFWHRIGTKRNAKKYFDWNLLNNNEKSENRKIKVGEIFT